MTSIHRSRGVSNTRLITKTSLSGANDHALADPGRLNSSDLGDLAGPVLRWPLVKDPGACSIALVRIVAWELERQEQQRG